VDNRGSIPGRGKRFVFTPRCQTGCGANPVAYPLSTGVFFSCDKAAELSPSIAEVKNNGARPPLPSLSVVIVLVHSVQRLPSKEQHNFEMAIKTYSRTTYRVTRGLTVWHDSHVVAVD
jgi:hypothetical protein